MEHYQNRKIQLHQLLFLCVLLAKKSPYFKIRGLIRSFTDYTFLHRMFAPEKTACNNCCNDKDHNTEIAIGKLDSDMVNDLSS